MSQSDIEEFTRRLMVAFPKMPRDTACVMACVMITFLLLEQVGDNDPELPL